MQPYGKPAAAFRSLMMYDDGDRSRVSGSGRNSGAAVSVVHFAHQVAEECSLELEPWESWTSFF